MEPNSCLKHLNLKIKKLKNLILKDRKSRTTDEKYKK